MNNNFLDKIKSFENLDKILDIYNNWEISFSNLKNRLNIDCIKYCSKCCDIDVSNIQGTIFELLLPAILFYEIIFDKYYNNIFNNNIQNNNNNNNNKKNKNNNNNDDYIIINFLEYNITLEKNFIKNKIIKFLFEENIIEDRCIFLKQEENNWGCSIYNLRPAICRLFGYSFKRDKHNNLVFSTCKEIKKSLSQNILFDYKIKNNNITYKREDTLLKEKANNTINNIQFPVYDNFYYEILSLNYQYTREFFNINEAFKKAFEIIYIKFNRFENNNVG